MSTAPPGTTVTGLIDVSGMLIIRGEGDGNGKLSFEGMKLGGGFKADKDSRIEVDMDFQVIMAGCSSLRCAVLVSKAASCTGLSLVTDKVLGSARCLSISTGRAAHCADFLDMRVAHITAVHARAHTWTG